MTLREFFISPIYYGICFVLALFCLVISAAALLLASNDFFMTLIFAATILLTFLTAIPFFLVNSLSAWKRNPMKR